mmetsp:Transcript_29819/g.77185  ORF Transcript_29819/g.77185 Transcript_29819/m.77185 type:complete len:456 (-) Transcript_29819:401-1768(-)
MCIFCTPDAPVDHNRLTDEELLEIERCPDLKARVPVTIVTGFLGAGKTTFVNWLLKGSHGRRFCVLQNEFGAVSVDDALIVKSERFADVAIMTLSSGCVCCKVRGDLVDGLRTLARNTVSEDGHFDAVVIETSGLSEVSPVAQTFFADRFVMRNFKLDAVVTLVDARASPDALRLARKGAAGMPPAPEKSSYSCDGESDNESHADSADDNSSSNAIGAAMDSGSFADKIRTVDEMRAQAARLLCEQICLADIVLLNKTDLLDAAELADVRELISEVNSTARILQCEHSRVDLSSVLHVNAFSVASVTTRDSCFLDEARRATAPLKSQRAGAAAFAFATPPPDPGDSSGRAHLHAAFRSCGVETSSDLDELAFSDWLEQVFTFHGSRLYRVKGVAFFRDVVEPSAVQCVGSHIECERMHPSELEPSVLAGRRTRLVFIGRIEGIEDGIAETFHALS